MARKQICGAVSQPKEQTAPGHRACGFHLNWIQPAEAFVDSDNEKKVDDERVDYWISTLRTR